MRARARHPAKWTGGVVALGALTLNCGSEPRARMAPAARSAPIAYPAPAASSAARDETGRIPADATLALSRSWCFGTCPVYSLDIHPDGTVRYEGEHFVATCGPAAGMISPATLHELLAELERIGFLEMRAEASARQQRCLVDNSSYTIEIQSPALRKRIESSEACRIGVPLEQLRRLSDFALRVDDVVGTKRWISPCEEEPDFFLATGQVNLHFTPGSAKLTDEARKSIDEIADDLGRHPERGLDVAAYSELTEEPRAVKLAEERAQSVVRYLVGRGLEERRLYTHTFGASKPIDASPASANRRVELRLSPPLRCGCKPG